MGKDKYIVSWNLAGRAWKLTKESWESRLSRACRFIKNASGDDAWLIGLSEVIPGTDRKYLKLIEKEFPEYVLVLPKDYDDSSCRSAINVLLIKRQGYQNHNVMSLTGLEDSLLYNFVTVCTDYGCYRVLSAHMPHTCNYGSAYWYRNARQRLRALFEEAVTETCRTYQTEPDIQFILMGDLNATPDSRFIKTLTGGVPLIFNATLNENRAEPTWSNPDISGSHIDYICYSMGSLMSSVIDLYYNEIKSEAVAEKISDHALLLGKVRTNITDWCA